MRIQRFFAVLLPAISLLAISMLTAGCYTQFATTESIERLSSPSTVDVEELVENSDDVVNVTINHYYDSYYARFMRPTIYGFGSAWGWYDPFWGYPLWYSPVIAPIAWYGFAPTYYGWGVGWGWNPNFPPYWAGGVASTEAIGTRRMGIGRSRMTGVQHTTFPTSSSLRYGSSGEGGTVAPNSRRQPDGASRTDATDFSRRTRASERKSDKTSKEQHGSYSAPSRRQSQGERRSQPSYSPPSQRSSPPAYAPSRSTSGSSSSGSSGRRQR